MERKIVGFHRDPKNDWVADLACGHGQHVRHNPPFESRPWVVTEEGRASKRGLPLDCVRCDALELPAAFRPYKRTAVFQAESIPAGLTSSHSTKPGVWAKIRILAGELRYVVMEPINQTLLLDSKHAGIIAPEVAHYVRPEGAVQFYVEFYRKPEA